MAAALSLSDSDTDGASVVTAASGGNGNWGARGNPPGCYKSGSQLVFMTLYHYQRSVTPSSHNNYRDIEDTIQVASGSCGRNKDGAAVTCLCATGPLCKETDGTTANSVGCICGTAACTPTNGLFCTFSLSRCAAMPVCLETDGTTANSAECICHRDAATCMEPTNGLLSYFAGQTKINSVGLAGYPDSWQGVCSRDWRNSKRFCFAKCTPTVGLYCDLSSNTCHKRPPVTCSANEAVANDDDCKCGVSDCDANSGFYCVSSSSKCSAGDPCESDNGSLENAKDCKCGTTICHKQKTANLPGEMFCHSNISFCSSACDPGTYRDTTVATTTDLNIAPYALLPSKEYCAVCAAGQYRSSSTNASHTCVPCAAGKFNGYPATYAEQHLECEDCTGGLSSRAGASVCSKLLPECQLDSDNSPIDPVEKCLCGSNTECTAVTGLLCHAADSTCKCPAGQYKDSSAICQDCKAGKFLALVGQEGIESCQPCETGKYANMTGAIACGTCPIGKEYVSAAADCRTCDGGKFQNSSTEVSASCSLCSSGFYNADQGKTRIPKKHEFCDECPEGLISGAGDTFCIGCPSGWSTTLANNSKPCEECPEGKKGVPDEEITLKKGVPSTKCVSCDPGQYQEFAELPFCVSIFDLSFSL